MPDRASINESGLRHQLTAGQITMVAVGGSIGTGLLLGTASAISLAGPAVILSFILLLAGAWISVRKGKRTKQGEAGTEQPEAAPAAGARPPNGPATLK